MASFAKRHNLTGDHKGKMLAVALFCRGCQQFKSAQECTCCYKDSGTQSRPSWKCCDCGGVCDPIDLKKLGREQRKSNKQTCGNDQLKEQQDERRCDDDRPGQSQAG